MNLLKFAVVKEGITVAAVAVAVALLGLTVKSCAVPSPAYAAEAMTAKEAAELLDGAVAAYTSSSQAFCTVFKIGPKQYATARHCADLTDGVKIEKGMSSQYVRSITVSGQKKMNGRHEDWAILNTSSERSDVAALSLACGEELYMGMPVAYMGYPYPAERTFGVGIVSSVTPSEDDDLNADFAIDVQAAPGASGSPVISLDTGNVIGVLTEGVFSPSIGAFLVGVESIEGVDQCEDSANAVDDSEDDVLSSDYDGSSPF